MTGIEIVGPEELYAELRQIQAAHDGLLNPEDVVAHAKKKTSILHGKFEWDDKVAGHLFRVDQARGIIRKFRVRVTDSDGEIKEVRAFASIKEGEEREYRDVFEVMARPDLQSQVFTGLKREALEWSKRAKAWAEFSDVVNAIEAVA